MNVEVSITVALTQSQLEAADICRLHPAEYARRMVIMASEGMMADPGYTSILSPKGSNLFKLKEIRNYD